MNTFWTEALNTNHIKRNEEPGATDTWISPLPSFSALSVQGPDALKFLQGQLSCDVASIDDSHASLGSHCNPQGRMVSNFRLFRPHAEQFVFILRDSLRDIAQKQLQKYIVFSKASLTHVDNLIVMGLHGPNASSIIADIFELSPSQQNGAVINDLGMAVQIDANKQSFELALYEESAKQLLPTLFDSASITDDKHWESVLIDNGLLYLHGDQSGEHIPLVIDLDKLGGISFKKGCYTGQEIIARMHYRGKAKKQLIRLAADGEVNAERHSKINDVSTGKAIGEIVSVAQTKNLTSLLAILNLSEDEAIPTLQLDNSGTPLHT